MRPHPTPSRSRSKARSTSGSGSLCLWVFEPEQVLPHGSVVSNTPPPPFRVGPFVLWRGSLALKSLFLGFFFVWFPNILSSLNSILVGSCCVRIAFVSPRSAGRKVAPPLPPGSSVILPPPALVFSFSLGSVREPTPSSLRAVPMRSFS